MAVWRLSALRLLLTLALGTAARPGLPLLDSPSPEPAVSPSPPSASPPPPSSPHVTAPPSPQLSASPTEPCFVIPPQFPVSYGQATLFDHPTLPTSPTAAQDLACGLGYTEWYAQLHYAAVNQRVHDACGMCLAVACAHPDLCVNATVTVLPVVVLDDCGHCNSGDLLLSPLAFREVSGLSQGSFPADWFFLPCGPFIQGSIRVNIMPGSNPYYHQLTFSNYADPIANATIKGQPLTMMDWHRWKWYNNGQLLDRTAPITVTLHSRGGAVRKASLPHIKDKQYDLGIQF